MKIIDGNALGEGVKYSEGKTRSTANFDSSELEAFKEELNQPTIKPAIESRQTPTEQQPESDKPVLYAGEITEFGDISVLHQRVCGSLAGWLFSVQDN